MLTDIYRPWGVAASGLSQLFGEAVTDAERVQLLQMDPANVTVEPEHYADIDTERYARVKPLLWMWEMFDRSPMGENLYLGVLFRRILARPSSAAAEGLQGFPPGQVLLGYNMEVGTAWSCTGMCCSMTAAASGSGTAPRFPTIRTSTATVTTS